MQYRIVEHESYNVIRKFSSEEVTQVIKDAVALIKYAQEVEDTLKEYDENKGSMFALDNLIDDLDSTQPVQVEALSNYGKFHGSAKSSSVNKAVNRAISQKRHIELRLERIALAGIEPTSAVREDVDKSLKYLIGCLSYFLCYEFAFYTVALSDESVVEIDSAHADYCKSVGADPKECAKYYSDLSMEYRISFGVFVDHPELEKPFIEIVGPDYQLIDEERLTLESVAKLIRGEIDLDQFMGEVSVYQDEDATVDQAGACEVDAF